MRRSRHLPPLLRTLALGAFALAAAPAPAIVPTHYAASVAKLIETVSSALKQIQQLRALSDSFVNLKDAIGDVDSVDTFKRGLRSATSHAATTHPAWERVQTPPESDRGPRRTTPATPDSARQALLDRQGPYTDWNPDQAVDRPKLASQGEAMEFVLAELYTDPARVSAAGATARSEIERVEALRARIRQSTALYAYTLASAMSAEWENQERVRHTLAEHLEDSESLREDVAVLTETALHTLSMRNNALLLESTALELASFNAIMLGNTTLAPAVRTALEGRAAP